MRDDADLAVAADELDHVLGGLGCSGLVVGRRGRDGDVAVDARVEGDDWDAAVFRLLEHRCDRGRIEGGDRDRRRVAVERGLQELHLLLHLRLVVGPLEGDGPSQLGGRFLSALVHRLPELVLVPLGDDGDLPVATRGAVGARGRGGEHRDCGDGDRRCAEHSPHGGRSLSEHGILLGWGGSVGGAGCARAVRAACGRCRCRRRRG